MKLLNTLIDRDTGHNEQTLTAPLLNLYDGDLHFPAIAGEPYVIANFVSTLDGVISFNAPGIASGSEISGSNQADQFVMGLLRASADAIIVGAHTVQDVAPESLWTAEYSSPASKILYENYRVERLGKSRFPIVVVVSGSGKLDLTRAVFRTPDMPVVIISTTAGRDALTREGATQMRNLEIFALDTTNRRVDPGAITHLLYERFNVQLLLHEGGAELFTYFLEAELIHELFLTLAPQVAGRATNVTRPGLVEGQTFMPNEAPWLRLISCKSAEDHLLLRYGYSGPRRSDAQQ